MVSPLALPAYLATSSTLIKSLKSSQDPPQGEFPNKIQIAREAFQNQEFKLHRKIAVLRDWILEEFGKIRGAKLTSANALLDTRYHDLLSDLLTAGDNRGHAALPIQSISRAFFTTLRANVGKIGNLSAILASATRSMQLLIGSASDDSSVVAGKAEGWLEVLGLVCAWIDKEESKDDIVAVNPLIRRIGSELVISLDVSQNRKKITQSLKPFIPCLLSVWTKHPELQSALEEPIRNLLFSLQVLQQEDSKEVYLLPFFLYQPGVESRTKLAFLPYFLSLLIQSLQKHRYILFPPNAATRSSVPTDVFISGRVRAAVLHSTRIILEAIEKISDPGKDQLERCLSRRALWTAVQRWGGYLEGNAEWSSMISQTIVETASLIEPHESPLSKASFQLLDVLINLDYRSCLVSTAEGSVGAKIVANALTARGDTAKEALDLVLNLLSYHTLTHDLLGMQRLLVRCVELSAHIGVAEEQYHAIATGPLAQPDFRNAFRHAVDDTLTGGVTADGTWASLLSILQDRLNTCVGTSSPDEVTSDITSKKRKKNDESSSKTDSQVDAKRNMVELSVLSRLAVIVLEAAEESPSNTAFASLPIVATVVERWAPHPNVDKNNKKRPSPGTWANDIKEAAVARLATAVSRLAPRNGSSQKWQISDVSTNHLQNELLYESVIAILDQAERIGQFTDEVAASLESLLSCTGKLWSGLIADISAETLSSALWQTVAERGLALLDFYADEKAVSKFAKILIERFDVPSAEQELGFVQKTALDRIMLSTDFWELGRLQAAILERLAEILQKDMPGIEAVKKMYIFLQYTPAEYLSRNIRNMSVNKAYEWDATIFASGKDSDTCTLLRRYLSRIASDTEYTGSVDSDVIDSLMRQHGTESNPALAQATDQLFSTLMRSLLREAKNEKNSGLLSYLVGRLVNDLNKNKNRNLVPVCSTVLTVLYDLGHGPDSLPTHILGGFDEIYRKLVKIFGKQTKSDDITVEQLALYRSCAAYQYWRKDPTQQQVAHTDLAKRAIQQALPLFKLEDQSSTTTAMALALPALEISSFSLRTGEEADLLFWLAAWIALRAAINKDVYRVDEFETLFKRSLSDITSEAYARLLAALLEALEVSGEKQDARVAAEIHACYLAIDLQIPNTGKTFRKSLSGLLASLACMIEGTSETDTKVKALQIVESICEKKAVVLTEQDASDILLLAYATLNLSGGARDTVSSEEPFRLVLSICNSLVRHRRDLVSNLLPHLMKVYSKSLDLFQRPRAAAGSGKLRNIIVQRRPTWLASSDEACLGESAAAVFSRTLVTLTGRTTIRRARTDAIAKGHQNALDRDLGSLVGQLSKHAPGILVGYVKVVADPFASIPIKVRRSIEPGLFALCEAVTAGGKAQYGKTPGEGVGEAFGLGEGENADAEYEVWGDLWQRWSGKRYTGQG